MYSKIVTSILDIGKLLLYGLSFLNLTAHRYPSDANVNNGTTFDYIVVGAGSAGSIIATRLTEDPDVRVLLIEAGGNSQIENNLPSLFAFIPKSYMDWNYYTSNECLECKENCAIELSRGKVLGGSSSTNFMLYVRGDPHNFNTWATIANDPQWNYENVLPYFKKSEKLQAPNVLNTSQAVFHGTNGYLGVTKPHFSTAPDLLNALNETGYDLVVDCNGNDTLGFAESEVTVADNIRQSTANAFLSRAKGRENLYVLKNTLVTKILMNKRKEAIGVEALDKLDRRLIFRARNEVIVSAGTMNSPQLLMLSGIGPRDHLETFDIKTISDLPVGKNLQDHWLVVIVIKTKKLSLDSPKLNEFPFSAVTGFVSLNETKRYPDYFTQIYTITPESFLGWCKIISITDDICDEFYRKTLGHSVIAATNVYLQSNITGEILLKSTDPKEHPKILVDPDPLSESHLETQLTYIKDYLRILNSTYLKSIDAELVSLDKCSHFELGSDDYLRCYTKCVFSTYWHYTGTCAMGSVVDSRLRVKGVRKLRVADASIMPTIPSGNTNAASMMIGEKAADIIKDDDRNWVTKRY